MRRFRQDSRATAVQIAAACCKIRFRRDHWCSSDPPSCGISEIPRVASWATDWLDKSNQLSPVGCLVGREHGLRSASTTATMLKTARPTSGCQPRPLCQPSLGSSDFDERLVRVLRAPATMMRGSLLIARVTRSDCKSSHSAGVYRLRWMSRPSAPLRFSTTSPNSKQSTSPTTMRSISLSARSSPLRWSRKRRRSGCWARISSTHRRSRQPGRRS
ncbi:hypothetical protein EV561_12220 [Rhizobium sp. BK376]|nr:hypothetical protein EV561_12220 [Rhizobium sp. BK376]